MSGALSPPQRLSGLDAAFLALDNRYSQMHTLKFAVLEPNQPGVVLTPEVVAEVLRRRLHAVPCYTQKLKFVPLGLHHPLLVNATDFRFEDHIHTVTVPQPGGRRERDAIIADICGGTLDRRRPLWEMWILDGLAGGRVGCLIKLHHTLADGRVAANQLLAFANAEEADLNVTDNTPTTFALIRDGLADRVRDLGNILALICDTRRTMQATRAIREHAPVRIPKLMSSPPTLFAERVTPARTWGTASLLLSQVTAVAKHYGVSVNDVLLAMLSGAVRGYLLAHGTLPDDPVPTMLPVDTSSPEAADELQGNHWSALMTTLATDEPDAVERLRTIRASMNVAKQIRNARGDLLERWAQYINAALLTKAATAYLESRFAARGKFPTVGVSNVRGPDSAASAGSAKVAEFYSVGPLPTSAVNVTAWSYAGQFNISLLAGRNVVPDAYEFLGLMRDALKELSDRAGMGWRAEELSEGRSLS